MMPYPICEKCGSEIHGEVCESCSLRAISINDKSSVPSTIVMVCISAVLAGGGSYFFALSFFPTLIICNSCLGLAYYFIWDKSPKCACGGKLECIEMKDPVGINITRKVTFSLYIGPRKYSYTWKCKECGAESNEKSWW